MRTSRNVKMTVLATLLAAIMVASILSAAFAAVTETYNGTNVDVTVVNYVVKAGERPNISVIVTNKMNDTSLEKVFILVNYTANIFNNIEILSADVYNSTGDKQGQWSYEVATIEYNGTNYTAINAYTFPGNLALSQGDYVNITFAADIVGQPGLYKILVIAVHTTASYQDVVVEEAEMNIIVDGYPPTIEVQQPRYNGTHYVSKTVTVNNKTYVNFTITIYDTYDGTNKLNLSQLPVTYTLTSDNRSIIKQESLSQDGTTLTIVGAINVTGENLTDGSVIPLNITATDAVGNTITMNISIVIDNTPPNITDVKLLHEDGTNLYYNGTYYFANAMDDYIIVKFKASDVSGIYSAKVYVDGQPVDAQLGQDGYYYANISIADYQANATVLIQIAAEDYAGNVNQTGEYKVFIDENAPRINVEATPEGGNTITLQPGQLYLYNATNVTVNVTVTDAESGFNATASSVVVEKYENIAATQPVETMTYNTWTNNEYIVVQLEPGYYYKVIVKAYDNAGNYKEETYQILIDDGQPPTLEYNVTGANYCNDTAKYYANSSVTIEGEVYDIGKINVTIYVNGTIAYQATNLNPGATFTYNTGDLNEGLYNITIVVEDMVGNAKKETLWLVVDKTSPALSQSEFDNYNNTVFDPYLEKPAIITFTDTSSPFTDEVEVYLDGTPITPAAVTKGEVNETYYITLNLSNIYDQITDGQHTLTVKVYDCAGNSKEVTYIFTIDTQPPVITVGQAGIVVEYWVGEIIHLNGTVEDLSGIEKILVEVYDNASNLVGSIEFYLNGTKTFNLSQLGAINLTAHNITLQPDIEYTVEVKVYDVLAEKSNDTDYVARHMSTATDHIKLDNVPPSFTLVYPADRYYEGIYWNNELPTTVEILVTDEGVGVDTNTIVVLVNGTPVTPVIEEEADGVHVYFNLTAEGVFNVTIKASDKLANQNSAAYKIGVDVTPPTVEFSTASVKGGLVVEGVNFVDNLSGLTNVSKIKLVINGTAYQVLIPVEAFNGGYYVGILSANAALVQEVQSWRDVVYFIGSQYNETFTEKKLQPFVAIVDGKILVFVQYLSEETSVTVKMCINDIAGNKGVYTVNATVVNGAFMPVMIASGWNLLSLPTTGTVTSDVIANSLLLGDGQITMIAVYDPDTGNYDVYIPGVSDTPLTISDGISFWVYYNGTGNGIIILQGNIPYDSTGGVPPMPIVYPIPEGGNFVGFTALQPLPLSYYLSSLFDAPVYEYVYLFDPARQIWVTVPIYANIDVLPGHGMWIYAYQDAALVVPTWYNIYPY